MGFFSLLSDLCYQKRKVTTSPQSDLVDSPDCCPFFNACYLGVCNVCSTFSTQSNQVSIEICWVTAQIKLMSFFPVVESSCDNLKTFPSLQCTSNLPNPWTCFSSSDKMRYIEVSFERDFVWVSPSFAAKPIHPSRFSQRQANRLQLNISYQPSISSDQ